MSLPEIPATALKFVAVERQLVSKVPDLNYAVFSVVQPSGITHPSPALHGRSTVLYSLSSPSVASEI